MTVEQLLWGARVESSILSPRGFNTSASSTRTRHYCTESGARIQAFESWSVAASIEIRRGPASRFKKTTISNQVEGSISLAACLNVGVRFNSSVLMDMDRTRKQTSTGLAFRVTVSCASTHKREIRQSFGRGSTTQTATPRSDLAPRTIRLRRPGIDRIHYRSIRRFCRRTSIRFWHHVSARVRTVHCTATTCIHLLNTCSLTCRLIWASRLARTI